MDLTTLSRSENTIILECIFAADDLCFTEHFPENPVIPGSLIISLALYCAQQFSHCGNKKLQVKKFAFHQFAGPGRYRLHVDAHEHALSCCLKTQDTVFATGAITCA